MRRRSKLGFGFLMRMIFPACAVLIIFIFVFSNKIEEHLQATTAGENAVKSSDNLLELSLESKAISYADVQVKPQLQANDASTFPAWLAGQLAGSGSVQADSIGKEVFVSFVVENDGTVKSVVLQGEQDAAVAREIVRLISSSMWKPGEHQGDKVAVSIGVVLPLSGR